MMNDSIKLDLNFDPERLNSNLDICLKEQWKNHFNERDYSGNWAAISLRSQTGKPEDILAHNINSPFKDTSLLLKCNYFNLILNQMKFEKESVRLLRLKPESVVKEHRDMGLAYRFGCFRLHIPITTDASVEFMVGGKNIQMKKGECWYADFDLPHSVSNKSEQERIHLVIDGKRNEWTDKLFTTSGYDIEEEKRVKDYPLETKKQMLEHLRLMKTDAANEIIKKLEGEIGNYY